VRPRVVLIAAMARDRTIGKAGGIPWRHPEDQRRFKAETMGHPLILGRRTFESFGRPLPGRFHVVLTRRPDSVAAGPQVTTAADLEEALRIAESRGASKACVVGGEDVYRRAMPVADEILLTLVPEEGGGDVFMPEIDPRLFREASREPVGDCTLVRYERV
jgi:dihydrofolate reductase